MFALAALSKMLPPNKPHPKAKNFNKLPPSNKHNPFTVTLAIFHSIGASYSYKRKSSVIGQIPVETTLPMNYSFDSARNFSLMTINQREIVCPLKTTY